MSEELSSGKGHRDENFPVASHLIARRHRAPILAFYKVARLADDIADHPAAPPEEKLARLKAVEASLTGAGREVPAAVQLRDTLLERGLSARHILDLLEAFRRDSVKARTADWADLMDYCRYSAAPVGRFVLDVHGESPATWPASDALCAALQVVNHLQDAGKDWRQVGRVYIPADEMAAAGLDAEALGAAVAPPVLRELIASLARRTLGLLDAARPLARQVSDARLALEIGVIHALVVDLAQGLTRRDPLAERVHHRPAEAIGVALRGVARTLVARVGSRQSRLRAP